MGIVQDFLQHSLKLSFNFNEFQLGMQRRYTAHFTRPGSLGLCSKLRMCTR